LKKAVNHTAAGKVKKCGANVVRKAFEKPLSTDFSPSPRPDQPLLLT
jgi:hypothetical protein